jgi:hypothetical protein
MRREDVRACAGIVAEDPLLARPYGEAIGDLAEAWLRSLGLDSFPAMVLEELEGAHVKLVGAGVAVFVSDEFMRAVKKPPLLWLGPELVRRTMRGESPLLSNRELREANARGKLNLVVWQRAIRPEDLRRPEVSLAVISTFLEAHRGFRIKEMLAPAESGEMLLAQRNAGAMYVNPKDGLYGEVPEVRVDEIFAEPRMNGLTHDLAQKRLGSWVGSLFVCPPPRFCFSKSEQRLLASAMNGGSAEELAGELKISVSAVKKTWCSIYRRVAERAPELAPGHSRNGSQVSERGKEKKKRLMAYLREHPEELRPISRKILESAASGPR